MTDALCAGDVHEVYHPQIHSDALYSQIHFNALSPQIHFNALNPKILNPLNFKSHGP
jgi:hypothetical protein